ncbi:hypothetical protein TRVA0_021S01508 [Trichomonascus vanleenenianus]|uniref:F-box protein n=1 Tax=Trichomonascus vanleenenianus TaxID=2268995 RepID=UPI003EC97C52
MEESDIFLNPIARTHSCLGSGSKRLPSRKPYYCNLAAYEALFYPPSLCGDLQLRNQRKFYSQEDPFNKLPEELVLMVLEKLSPWGLASASTVCRKWRRLCHDNTLWRHMVEAEERYYMPYSLPVHTDWRNLYIQKQRMYKVFQGIEDIYCIVMPGALTFQVSLTDTILLRIELSGQMALFDCSCDEYYPLGKNFMFYQEFSQAITREHLTPMTDGKIDNRELILSFASGEVAIVDLKTFKSKRFMVFLEIAICQLEVTSDYIVARGLNHKIAVINRKDPNAEIVRLSPNSEVVAVDVVDDTVFASTARYGIVAWDLETMERTVLTKDKPTHIYNSKTPNQLIYGSRALGTIRIFDLETKQVTLSRSFKKTIFGVYDYIAAVGDDSTIEFVHIPSGEVIARYNVWDLHCGALENAVVESASFNFKHCVLQMTEGSTIILTYCDKFDQAYLDCMAP